MVREGTEESIKIGGRGKVCYGRKRGSGGTIEGM